MSKSYYDILGVSESASPAEIKRQFRKLAMKYHPDRNHGDKAAEDKFKTISEAYETLSDAKKKQEYDTMRKYGAFTGARAGGGGQADFSQFFRQGGPRGGGFQTFRSGGLDGLEGFEDILNSLFGDKGRGGSFSFSTDGRTDRSSSSQQRQQRAPNLEALVTITFMEAVRGTQRELTLQPIGRKLKVKIPAGIANGGKIRLRGQGQPDPYTGKNSDLIITVNVMPDQNFERKGNDIYTKVKISFKDAILGTKTNVKTLTKTVLLNIKPGTQPGTLMRLKDLGLAVGKNTGDCYVRIDVEIPTTLTDEQRKVLEKWEE